jgi:hypothetical protein
MHVAALKAMRKPLFAEEVNHLQVFEDKESEMKGDDNFMMIQMARLNICLMHSSGVLKYMTI